MRIRASLALLYSTFAALIAATPALAGEGGEGLYGKTSDKVVTNFGFGLMIFFVVLVVGLSVAQHLLDKRKRTK